MKTLITIFCILMINSAFATSIRIVPLIDGELHTDTQWGAIDYTIKRLSDNKVFRVNFLEEFELYKSGKYEVSGDSAHNICYASTEVVEINKNSQEIIDVILNIECE